MVTQLSKCWRQSLNWVLSDSEAFRFNRRLQPWGTNPRCSHHLELKVIFVVHGAPRSEGLVSLELPSFSRIGLMVSHMGCPGRGVDQVGGSLVATSAPVTHFFRSRKEDNTDCSSSHGSVQGWLPHFKEWQIEAQRCPVPGIPFSPLAQEFWSLIVMLF